MTSTWTFGQKLGAGFAAVVASGLLIALISIFALRSVVTAKDKVILVNAQNLIDAARLETLAEERAGNQRAFFLTRDTQFLERQKTVRVEFDQLLVQMQARSLSDEEHRALKALIVPSEAQKEISNRMIDAIQKNAPDEDVKKMFQDELVPVYDDFRRTRDAFVAAASSTLEKAEAEATELANFSSNLALSVAAIGVILAIAIGSILSRLLNSQIGSAVQHIQSSSSELQAAANQQTAGTKEQVASMTEISTTIKELVLTAKQIAESAQRVAHIAEDTANGANSGNDTVQKAQDAVSSIKRQVDLIVTHMLDLGKKSQQIGGILEIINELAEQTNILSINATIESAGAGEAGKRFTVVADEIRKLADRVSGSTKEIRTLIDEIRAAVNTTVMATESGSKAVDAGTRQFSEVAMVFRQIVGSVSTTTQAAREIELSTKQQTTAVEQVNIAISNVAQAAKESETSSMQTLQTVSELSSLSKNLTRLIQSQVSG